MLPYQHFTTCATIQWPPVIFSIYYASSFNSAFRHSSFRIVESSYCFCSALILLLSSLFRFYSLSLSYLPCRTGNRGSGSGYDTVCLCVGRFIFWHLSWVAFFLFMYTVQHLPTLLISNRNVNAHHFRCLFLLAVAYSSDFVYLQFNNCHSDDNINRSHRICIEWPQ